MQKKDFTLNTPDSEKIQVTVFGIENVGYAPCLIYINGFKSFKDWGFVPYLGEYFAQQNYLVITFNFSFSGIGNNPLEFTEFDKFAKDTPSREIFELSLILDSYSRGFFGKTKNEKIGLIGHSRGGAISILTAAQNPGIDALAVWASISDFDRYTEHQKREWKEKGYYKVMNKRTGLDLRLDLSYLDDIEKNKKGLLNIEKAVNNLNRPLLIIHGEQDLTVPLTESQKIYDWSDKNLTKFDKIEAAGHTFGIKHPFEGSNPKFESVLSSTLSFFNTHLKA